MMTNTDSNLLRIGTFIQKELQFYEQYEFNIETIIKKIPTFLQEEITSNKNFNINDYQKLIQIIILEQTKHYNYYNNYNIILEKQLNIFTDILNESMQELNQQTSKIKQKIAHLM